MKNKKLAEIRKSYNKGELSMDYCGNDPFIFFGRCMNHAIASNIEEPTAMTLSTAQSNGRCSARIVLLKYFDDQAFYFFTNYQSAKAKQISENNWASLLFFWPKLEQQIRIEGEIKKCDASLSDEYFEQRPLESRISAIISPQSEPIESREFLKQKVTDFREADLPIKRPDYWGGYQLEPQSFEFWQGRPNRLHNRVLFELVNSNWQKSLLAP